MKTLAVNFLMILAAATLSLNAQETKKVKFEIETDPLAFAIGGRSGHAAIAWKNERLQLGYGQLNEMPESLADNPEITEGFKAISLKWDYFLFRDDANKGFFFGPTFDYLFMKFSDGENNSVKTKQFAAGIRTGYKFDLFKKSKVLNGLYATPWVGVNYLFNNGDINLGGNTYERASVRFFPTVHLGYRF